MRSGLAAYFVAPLCKSAGAKYAREWGNHACGAGPFRLEQWQVSREVVLVRHQGYFEPGLPYLDRIRWQQLVPPTTQRFKFEDGDLDHIRLDYERLADEARKELKQGGVDTGCPALGAAGAKGEGEMSAAETGGASAPLTSDQVLDELVFLAKVCHAVLRHRRVLTRRFHLGW